MGNTVLALQIILELFSLGINGLVAAEKYTALVLKARTENREISDEELAEIREANQALTKTVLEKLE
jgi:hypothetical protein